MAVQRYERVSKNMLFRVLVYSETQNMDDSFENNKTQKIWPLYFIAMIPKTSFAFDLLKHVACNEGITIYDNNYPYVL